MLKRLFFQCVVLFTLVASGHAAERFISFSSGDLDLTHPSVYVDAKDERAAGFYLAFGFRQAPENGLLLFMPLPEIQELLQG